MLGVLQFIKLQILKSSSCNDYNYLFIELLIIVVTIWLSSVERSQNNEFFMLRRPSRILAAILKKKNAPKIFLQLKHNTHKL